MESRSAMDLAPLWMRGLTPLGVEVAKEKLGETTEVKQKCLAKLRKLIEEENGFDPLQTDASLLRFLRCKKYDVKRSFKTLKNYYAYRARYSGVLTDLTPSDIKHILDTQCCFASPKRSPEGCGLLVVLLGAFDVDTFSPEDLIGASLTACEIGNETEMSQVCGSQAVIDWQGMTFSKMRHYSSIALLSKIIRGLQDCLPFRITAIHFTNEPSYFGMLYSIIRTMMTKKLRDRIHLHGINMESLHKFLHPESLPMQLGGTLGEKDFQHFNEIVLKNEHISKR